MLFLYLVISFGFSWILWVPEALVVNNVSSNFFIIFLSKLSNFGAWGPFLAAIVVSLKKSRKDGLKKLFKQTFSMSFDKKWYIPTFLLFPLIIGLPLLLLRVFGLQVPISEALNNPFVLPIAFLVILFNAGPLQEEYGWRGIMQLELQKKYSALISSLLVGIVWGIWHLPLFFMPDKGFYYDKPIWGLILSTTLISVLFGWIYNNTNRNLLLMLLFHASYNFSHYVFPSLESETSSMIYMLSLISLVAIVIFKNGLKLSRTKTDL
ncbi:CPBP family intramembrane glutamic endopeptidase [Patescibacteria group bacterium]